MDFSRLSTGAKLALVSAAILAVNLFLPWYSVDFGIVKATLNAFDADFLAWGGSLIAIAGATVLLLKAMGTKTVSAGQLLTEQLALILGGIGLILIVLRWITKSNFVDFGVYLGIVAAALVTYGSFMAMKDAMLDIPGMADGDPGIQGNTYEAEPLGFPPEQCPGCERTKGHSPGCPFA